MRLKKQIDAYAKLYDETTKYLVYGGAAGGGKSWLGNEWLMMMCHYYPNTRWFIGRANIKDSVESVLITFKKVANSWNYSDYGYSNNGIKFKNGSEIVFLDCSFYPKKDPLFERFGSKEFTGGWLEEAGELTLAAFDTLKSRIGRHLNAELNLKPKILITCNPKKNWLYEDFYKPFKSGTLDKDSAFIQALPRDNNFLTKEYLEALHSIKSKSKKERLLFGNWEYDDDPMTMIDYDKIVDMFHNSHIEKGTKQYLTCDIAAYGSDKFVLARFKGWNVKEVIEFDKSGGALIINTIKHLQSKYKIPQSNIVFDSDGVGGLIGGKTGFLPRAVEFVNNGTPLKGKKKDVQNYANRKTQCYYKLAELINANEINFDCDLPTKAKSDLMQELECLKRVESDDNKLKMIRKKDIKEIIGRSPDYADALMMRCVFEFEKIRKGWSGSSGMT